MLILLVYIEGIPNPFGLRYKSRERAEREQAEITRPITAADSRPINVTDEFGQSIMGVSRHRLVAAHLMDVDRDLEAQAELALAQARANARTQAQANSDPMLKFHTAQQPGGPRMMVQPGQR
jgi:hypothetical protein